MNLPSGRLPAPARAIATAVTDTVSAARSLEVAEFLRAATRLAALDREQVGRVLGAVVRSLLEELHPDGLAGDDVQAVLDRCVRSAAGWFPDVDAGVVAALLIGALGLPPAEGGSGPPGGLDVARHAPLIVADLLAVAGRPLTGYLDAAFAEIARAETVEAP